MFVSSIFRAVFVEKYIQDDIGSYYVAVAGACKVGIERVNML